MPGILCEHCSGHCCRYIALPIETPTERSDFDDIRWYLLHESISVFVEDGEWYINIMTNCRHLRADFLCGIYETRPRICREYSTDACDYHSGDYGWQQHFTCPEHLDEYVRLHFKPGAKRRKNGKRKVRGIGVKAKLRRKEAGFDYAGMVADIRGVSLPVLPTPR